MLVLQTWDTQLRQSVNCSRYLKYLLTDTRHLHSGTTSWYVFHGCGRTKGVGLLGQFDVIITTYKTLSMEWKKYIHSHRPEESLFSLSWHRIILDEGESLTEPPNGTNFSQLRRFKTRRHRLRKLHVHCRQLIAGQSVGHPFKTG